MNNHVIEYIKFSTVKKYPKKFQSIFGYEGNQKGKQKSHPNINVKYKINKQKKLTMKQQEISEKNEIQIKDWCLLIARL